MLAYRTNISALLNTAIPSAVKIGKAPPSTRREPRKSVVSAGMSYPMRIIKLRKTTVPHTGSVMSTRALRKDMTLPDVQQTPLRVYAPSSKGISHKIAYTIPLIAFIVKPTPV
jgi:hypothetical protein